MTAPCEVPDWYAKAIAQRPGHTEVDVGGVRIHCRTWGNDSAPIMLLLHGGAAHSGWWDLLAPALAVNHHVVAPDLSGHGDSHHRTSYCIEDWAAEVVAVLGTFGAPESTSLVGHSRGGMLALLAERLSPTPLRNLVIIESAFGLKTSRPRRRGDGMIVARDYTSEAEILSRFTLMPDEPVADAIAVHIAAESVRGTGTGWTWKFDRRIQGVPPLELDDLTPPRCATTLVRSDDGLCGAESYAVAADLLRAQQVVMPGGGHHVLLRKPQELIDVISDALAEEAG